MLLAVGRADDRKLCDRLQYDAWPEQRRWVMEVCRPIANRILNVKEGWRS